ncbi:MAG TPA: glutaredoxin family protein [Nitrolancea sp.]|nr:glutaredoxin family protein [Nitrolancea sp.]
MSAPTDHDSQELTSETGENSMTTDRLRIYGTTWCGQCYMARRYFDEHDVPYDFIDIDRDEQGLRFVEATNGGMRSVPTIVFPDGTILVEPGRRQLAAKFGIVEESLWQRLVPRR